MIRWIAFCLAGLLAVSTITVSCKKAPGFQYVKKSGGVSITISTSGKALVKGVNDLKISIVDSSGRPVPNAMVDVRYFSAFVPGRPQLDVSSPAMPKGDAYSLKAEIPAAGEWNFEIHITRPETKEPPADASFKAEIQ